jgi:hypothetical protein
VAKECRRPEYVFGLNIMASEYVEVTATLIDVEHVVPVAPVEVGPGRVGSLARRAFGIERGKERTFVFPGHPFVGAGGKMDLAKDDL